MGRTLIKVLIIILLIHALAGMGLLAYGLATGRFAPDRVKQYLATWRGQELVPPPPESVVEEERESPRAAVARIAAAEGEQEMLTRELQMRLERLRTMALTVASAQNKVEKERQQLAQLQDEFSQANQQAQDLARAAGFQKALKSYSNMKPKLVKEDFMRMADQEAVRYLSAMKPDVATAILEKFKTDSEQEKRLRLIRLLEVPPEPDPTEPLAQNQ